MTSIGHRSAEFLPGGFLVDLGSRMPPSPRRKTEVAFANHMIVQHMEHEYVISFYQMTVPPKVDLGVEDLQKILAASGGVSMRCVGRIAISNGRMPSVVAALATSLARNQEKHPKPERKTDEGK